MAELAGTCRNLPELCRNFAGTLPELCRNSRRSAHSKFIKFHKRSGACGGLCGGWGERFAYSSLLPPEGPGDIGEILTAAAAATTAARGGGSAAAAEAAAVAGSGESVVQAPAAGRQRRQ